MGGALNSLLTTIPNRNYRSDRPGGLILYCTALFCTVLYKKRRIKEGKMRKFADKEQRTDRQSSVSTTESTLILSGYSRELANIEERCFPHLFPKGNGGYLSTYASTKVTFSNYIKMRLNGIDRRYANDHQYIIFLYQIKESLEIKR